MSVGIHRHARGRTTVSADEPDGPTVAYARLRAEWMNR
jgi:hypothetical protein